MTCARGREAVGPHWWPIAFVQGMLTEAVAPLIAPADHCNAEQVATSELLFGRMPSPCQY